MSTPYGPPGGAPDPSGQNPYGQQPPQPQPPYGQQPPPPAYGQQPPGYPAQPAYGQPPAPYGQPGMPPAAYGGRIGETRGVGVTFLLLVVTFGIYLWFLQSKMNGEMNGYNPAVKRANVALSAWLLLACGVGSILLWISIIENAGRIKQVQRAAGMAESCSTFGSIFGGWSMLYHQAKLNEVWAHVQRTQGGQPGYGA